MKTLKEFIENPEIYCDMDGVLVDLYGGIKKHLRVTKLNQGIMDDFFDSDAGRSSEFWANCPWESGGKQLWKAIKDFNTNILSACPSVCNEDRKVIKGKTQWCQKNLKINSRKVYIVQRREKQNFAKDNKILIDDREKNIREWESSGGIGILHKNYNNTVKQLKGIIK